MRALFTLLLLVPQLTFADAQVIDYFSSKLKYTMRPLFAHRYLFETDWGAICPAALLIEEPSAQHPDHYLTLAMDYDGVLTSVFRSSISTLGMSESERDQVMVANAARLPGRHFSYVVSAEPYAVTIVRPAFRGHKKTDYYTRAELRNGRLYFHEWKREFRTRGPRRASGRYFATSSKIDGKTISLEAKLDASFTIRHLLEMAQEKVDVERLRLPGSTCAATLVVK